MFLVVGLGNPSSEYENTRHNFGFMAIKALAQKLEIAPQDISAEKMMAATWFKAETEGVQLIAAKPSAYMNESGLAVKNLLKKFRLEVDNLMIVHDDLDLELGQVKIKKGSSSAGHLGVESVINHLGTRDFYRVRLGIGRPPGKKDPSVFVLENFRKAEMETVEEVAFQAADAIIELVAELSRSAE